MELKDDREYAIKQAMEEIGQGLSCRAAAQKWGIPRSTLRNRISGTQNRFAGHEAQMKLSPEQENVVASWVIDEEASGRPPTRRKVSNFAGGILNSNGDGGFIGKRWIDGFLQRHPGVITKMAYHLESPEAHITSP